jgi:hypothetical protein
MLELVLLLVAITTVAAIARGRGATPWLWGTVAAVGYIAVGLVAFYAVESGFVTVPSPATARFFLPGIAGWGWIACVAVYLRFFRGRGAVQPEGQWTCPDCKWLNARYSIVCEACGQPFGQS